MHYLPVIIFQEEPINHDLLYSSLLRRDAYGAEKRTLAVPGAEKRTLAVPGGGERCTPAVPDDAKEKCQRKDSRSIGRRQKMSTHAVPYCTKRCPFVVPGNGMISSDADIKDT